MDSAIDIITAYVTGLASSNITVMQALWSEEYVLDWVHGDAFENNPLTTTETAAFWPAWFAAFPEMDYEVTRTIAGETVVVTQWIFTGVHTQPLGSPVLIPQSKPKTAPSAFVACQSMMLAMEKSNVKPLILTWQL